MIKVYDKFRNFVDLDSIVDCC